jgi:hypothetical protein
MIRVGDTPSSKMKKYSIESLAQSQVVMASTASNIQEEVQKRPII